MSTAIGVKRWIGFCVCVCVCVCVCLCRSAAEACRLTHAEQTREEEAGEEVYGGAERYRWRFTCTGTTSHRHDTTRTEVQKTHTHMHMHTHTADILCFHPSINIHDDTSDDDFHCLLCSLRLHLFKQKYSNISNIVKYYYNIK